MRRIALIGHDDLLCRRLRAAVDGIASVSMLLPSSFGPEIGALKPALVVLALEADRDPAFLATTFATLAGVIPGTPVVVLGDATNGAEVVAAVRAGSSDFIDRDEAVAAMRDHLKRQLAALTEAEQGEPGNFSVVIDARPGGGSGSFALDLAIIRARAGGEALLVDCQLPVSEAGAALDMPLSYSLADAVRDAGRLDRTLLQSALAQHKPSGVRVLPLALRPGESAGMSPEAVMKALGAMRPLFREIVVNASEIRDPAILTALMKWATAMYLVCPQKFTALADAKDLLMALPMDSGARTTLVVDAFRPAISLSPDQMLSTLGLTQLAVLPDARDELINGLNVGRPFLLSNPGSPYAVAVEQAADVQGAAPAAPQHGLIQSLARRMRGARS